MNLALTRIDERLIHGQVMTAWLSVTGSDRILIVDDETYQDEFVQQVLELAAPKNVEVKVLDVAGAKQVFSRDQDERKTILLFKHPLYVWKLIESGVSLREVELGNMGSKPSRNKLCKMVYVSQEEDDLFDRINENGCTVYVRMLPNDPKRLYSEVKNKE